MSMYEFLTRPFLNRLAEQLGISYREMTALSHNEIKEALAGKINSQELRVRAQDRGDMKWMVFSDENNKLAYIYNREDIKFFEETMIPRADAETRELKGEIGNRGKVKGIIRIIMNVDDFSKFRPGEILVTTMTTPDFVILMQKSVAIVTDIGGMLCHAAIMSREINKPCVIGTRFATQILKDGDLVEVDADNGAVRIIENA